jgi:hypothetical protein
MSGDTMSVNVKHGSVINPIQTTGEIFKGAALCESAGVSYINAHWPN